MIVRGYLYTHSLQINSRATFIYIKQGQRLEGYGGVTPPGIHESRLLGKNEKLVGKFGKY